MFVGGVTVTEIEAKEKYLLARRLALSGYWLLHDTARAVRECNGIGADWFPAWLRTAGKG